MPSRKVDSFTLGSRDTVHQLCNQVTNIDPDDLLTHWLRPGVTVMRVSPILMFLKLEIYIATGCSQDYLKGITNAQYRYRFTA